MTGNLISSDVQPRDPTRIPHRRIDETFSVQETTIKLLTTSGNNVCVMLKNKKMLILNNKTTVLYAAETCVLLVRVDPWTL